MSDKPTKDAFEKIGALTKMSSEEVQIIKNTVAKGTTNTELAYFLMTCKSMDLNPLNKEVWCYKDNKDNLLIFAGRDGFLAKAQKSPQFKGLRSSDVRSGDTFSIDIPNASIEHNISAFGKSRGDIIGAYAIVYRHDGEPTIELADFATYNKAYHKTFNAWKSHPEAMIKKVAEANALKKAFGISGLQVEYSWNVSNGVARPYNGNDTLIGPWSEKGNRIIELSNLAFGGDHQTEEIVNEVRLGITEQRANELLSELSEAMPDSITHGIPTTGAGYLMGDISKHQRRILSEQD